MMYRYIFLQLMFLASLSAIDNQIPSCYDAYDIDIPHTEVNQELFVIIDQTTVLDQNIQNKVLESTKKFIKEGNMINVITFSSNVDNHYMDITFSGKLERELNKNQKNSQPKKTLRKFETCMQKQYQFAVSKTYNSLKLAFNDSTSKIPKSDILKSLYQISEYGVKYSQANEKIILISSDMLENSSITSFYAEGTLKSIEPDKEFDKFIKSALTTDFKHARIYVIGAGITQDKHYINPKTMQQLKAFWSRYFERNNANLIEFGEPMILGTVK